MSSQESNTSSLNARGSDLESFDLIEREISAIKVEAVDLIRTANSLDSLSRYETQILGKKSAIAALHRSLASMDPKGRRSVGQQLHELRSHLEGEFRQRSKALGAAERLVTLERERLDLSEVILDTVSFPASRGHLNLISKTRDELEDVFIAMGFQVAEGSEAETDWYNFEALNMPPSHPARAMYDTFYLDLGEPETIVLRTHTSPVQIHLMENAIANDALPIHAVMPGRCFRRETEDARHGAVFHQIEGLVVDRGISFADLAGTIETFTSAYFGPDSHSRLRPAYFPFTEPSAEFEITCSICSGHGCRTCSGTGWIELGGCGMVDPAVFGAVGIDSTEWSGFAFGFGIDRCAQMRYEISDMRVMLENDIRFLKQF